MNETVSVSVDRKEEGFFVCLDQKGKEYLVPTAVAALKEGDLVLLTYRNGTLLSALVDKEATERKKAENKSRLRSLFNKNK